MEDQYSISSANLKKIERNLDSIFGNIQIVDSHVEQVSDKVGKVDGNIKVVYSQIEQLSREFHSFVSIQIKANRLGQAETRLVKIRQELDKKYGHYDVVRRMTTGILQADDLGIVRKTTISDITEEMMLTTPGYWLAPCLVALAAWINDQPELAEKALREAIRRDDEKTSLLFGLICRRVGRKNASLKWVQRYMQNQNEEQLDRTAVIVLDAYAGGLFGADPEGLVAKEMQKWLDNLSAKPGFVEKQTEQWAEAIEWKRTVLPETVYPYLRSCSKTWSKIENSLTGAALHGIIYDYFTNIFEQEEDMGSVKEQLDEVLDKLVTEFDEEELPLRREEALEQFVVDYQGDEELAKQKMQVEKTALEEDKDFTQLLTDAAMKPESSGASIATQKLSIAMSKEWITTAYNDIIAKNRIEIPHEIEINIDNFNDKTKDGKNEAELIQRVEAQVERERQVALAGVGLSTFENICFFAGIVIAIAAIYLLLEGNVVFGVIAAVAALLCVGYHMSAKQGADEDYTRINKEHDIKKDKIKQMVRATLAEVVDFRAEYAKKDAESEKVLSLLEQIAPEQYIRRLEDSSRRIKV